MFLVGLMQQQTLCLTACVFCSPNNCCLIATLKLGVSDKMLKRPQEVKQGQSMSEGIGVLMSQAQQELQLRLLHIVS